MLGLVTSDLAERCRAGRISISGRPRCRRHRACPRSGPHGPGDDLSEATEQPRRSGRGRRGLMLLGACSSSGPRLSSPASLARSDRRRRVRGDSCSGPCAHGLHATEPASLDAASVARALALGVSVAFMNQCLLPSDRADPPRGAVAIEYLGPFMVSALGKRSMRTLRPSWSLAGLGVLAIARPGRGAQRDGHPLRGRVGSRVGVVPLRRPSCRGPGRRFGGSRSRCPIGASVVAVSAFGSSAFVLSHPTSCASGPRGGDVPRARFRRELSALRRLKPSTAGVLVAFDPVLAFLVGRLLLSQRVSGGIRGSGVRGAGRASASPTIPPGRF